MERIIPISKICIAVAVPPELKNGSDIPVFGIEFVTTAMLSITWSASFAVRP